MHYVLKNKIKDGLVADADSLTEEFYRAQNQLLNLDQNNIGDAEDALFPGSPVIMRTGITQTAFAGPTSDESSEAYKSLTRWHHDSNPSGRNITKADTWEDQTPGPGIGAEVIFKVYMTGPYLFFGFAQLRSESVEDLGNPMRASVSIRLDGQILQPPATVGYANTQQVGGEWIYAPVAFTASRVLFPGDHRAILSVKQDPGDNIEVQAVSIAAIGLIR